MNFNVKSTITALNFLSFTVIVLYTLYLVSVILTFRVGSVSFVSVLLSGAATMVFYVQTVFFEKSNKKFLKLYYSIKDKAEKELVLDLPNHSAPKFFSGTIGRTLLMVILITSLLFSFILMFLGSKGLIP